MIKKSKSLFAFTLAEVLITLGVIGVVAAMTMPTVIKKYQQHVLETRLKKTYSLFNQAVKMAEAVEGPAKYWDKGLSGNEKENSKKVAEKYILPYVKAEYCDSGSTDNKCAKYVGCGSAAVNYNLSDGTMFSVCTYIATSDIIISISPMKTLKKGQGKFTFYINQDSGIFSPRYYDESLTHDDYINGYKVQYGGGKITVACSHNANAEYPYHACGALLYSENWKIPKDYPW